MPGASALNRSLEHYVLLLNVPIGKLRLEHGRALLRSHIKVGMKGLEPRSLVSGSGLFLSHD